MSDFTIPFDTPRPMIPGFRRDFDAARDPAAARNALEIVEARIWTPVLTFATPGDLSVAYTAQLGTLTRIGKLVIATFNVATSSFTHSTATGNLNITGLPFTAANRTNEIFIGSCIWGGITKATYTQVTPRVANGVAVISFQASGSGVATSNVAVADVPSGGTVVLRGVVFYQM